MAPWEAKSPIWWVAPVSVGGLLVLFLGFMLRAASRISVDIFEHCEPSTLKESARNVWTNVAVTGALLLTVVVPMLQLDPFSPQFMDAEEVAENIASLQEVYVAFTIVAICSVLISIFQCVINLTYLEPLRPHDAIKYFIANPNAFGIPVVLMVMSCVFLLLALIVWTFATYGHPNGVLLSVCSGLVIIVLAVHTWDKSKFDPSGQTAKAVEWQWTQMPKEKWPVLAKALDSKTAQVFQRLGEVARELEKEAESAPQPSPAKAD